jgi:two-component system LytT family sensor kinase
LTEPMPTLRWTTILLWALAVATPLGWSSVAFVYFGMLAVGRPLTFEHALLAGLQDWYPWAALSPLIFWLGRRFRLEGRGWAVALPVHLACGTAVALADLAIVTAINQYFGPTVSFVGTFGEVYPRIVLRYFHFAFIIYWVIVAAAHALEYYRASRDRELEALRLQAELTQAQLAALRMQIQPHFLFNTLHTIASLVRDGRSEAATSTIARLGELFRQTLGNGQRNEVPLRDELSFVQAYLEIEQTRFSDRLAVRFDVDPGTLEGRIPTMALQPLVENAIRHGIARHPSAGRVEVRAMRSNGALRVEVANDGPDAEVPGERQVGVGLANTRARLSRLYGSAARLELETVHGRGTVAVLEVPWRPDQGGR